MQLTTITTAIAALAMGMGVSAAEPEAIQIKGTIFGDNQCSGKTSLGQFNITTVDATRCTTFTEHSNVEESAVHSIRIKSMNPKCSLYVYTGPFCRAFAHEITADNSCHQSDRFGWQSYFLACPHI